MSFILRMVSGLIAVWATVHIGKLIGVGLDWKGVWRGLLFVIVLAFVNAVIRPVVKLFAMPLNCLTFGLFALVINALLFWATAAVTGFIEVKGFWAALFGSLMLGFLSAVINTFLGVGDKHSKKK